MAFQPVTQYPGSISGITPVAGFIGEVLSSAVANSTVNLSTGVAANITSLSITAGNWLVFGTVGIVFSGGGTQAVGGVNAASATFTTAGVDYSQLDIATIANTQVVVAPMQPLSLSGSTTYYLNGEAAFGSGTATAGGTITAVRVS